MKWEGKGERKGNVVETPTERCGLLVYGDVSL